MLEIPGVYIHSSGTGTVRCADRVAGSGSLFFAVHLDRDDFESGLRKQPEQFGQLRLHLRDVMAVRVQNIVARRRCLALDCSEWTSRSFSNRGIPAAWRGPSSGFPIPSLAPYRARRFAPESCPWWSSPGRLRDTARLHRAEPRAPGRCGHLAHILRARTCRASRTPGAPLCRSLSRSHRAGVSGPGAEIAVSGNPVERRGECA